ncbi:hypothetical protein ACP70R_012055 [Stipagrostis hirtigluma subsp. patula]
MSSSVILLIMVAIGSAIVDGHPVASTQAAQYWRKALPDTPMPMAIADLVQKGIDHSPLTEHYSALPSISVCTLPNTICPTSMVAETGIFFHEEQLHPGSTMTVSLPAEADAAILPHDVAEKVPFDNLEDVLTMFSIPTGSIEANQVANTLSRCRASPRGKQVSCTRSLQSTVQTAMDMLGTTHGVWAATSVLPATGLPRQPYVIVKVTKINGDAYVACHKVPFPYAVYQCHHTKSSGYEFWLRTHNGGPMAKMAAICHLDTFEWDPAHPAFEILHTHPGGAPVCHFMPNGNIVFIRKKVHA